MFMSIDACAGTKNECVGVVVPRVTFPAAASNICTNTPAAFGLYTLTEYTSQVDAFTVVNEFESALLKYGWEGMFIGSSLKRVMKIKDLVHLLDVANSEPVDKLAVRAIPCVKRIAARAAEIRSNNEVTRR
jgi:hypothetical protein